MPTTNNFVPVTNHRSVDIESQQAIQTAPKPYNKVVTMAKLGAIAGMCAATSGLLLADLAKAHNITLPVQHGHGRELLDLPVNGTCPEGQHLFDKEEALSGTKRLLWISAGVLPGIAILTGILSCLTGEKCCLLKNTLRGLAAASIIFSGIGTTVGIAYLIGIKKMKDGHCYARRSN